MRSVTRSLATKLTLAFLLVGALGILIFALLVGLQTRTEFDRFLSERDQDLVVETLADFYSDTGSWAGVGESVGANPAIGFHMRSALILDTEGNVLFGNADPGTGEAVQAELTTDPLAIAVDGTTVGYVAFMARPLRTEARPPSPIEQDFIRRALIAAVTSGIVTLLVAFSVGTVLARTLSRPITELTDATRAMAAGDLHQEVTVRSTDEIGELAHSFNQMSADLARASLLRKQMTADLAHDLRTPLSILRGYAEGLAEERIKGSPKLFGIMHDEVVHLQRLVEELRTLSLADAGELTLNRRTVDPRALLERAGLAYMAAAEERGLALRVNAPESLPSVEVDTDRMAQVLNNLVSNALRHTEQGEIALSARAVDEGVSIEVQDTGKGIEAEDLPYVFDRFYRGDKSRQRSDGDNGPSGLGLAIARAIVEAHGGQISVSSTPGTGATFRMLLPAAGA